MSFFTRLFRGGNGGDAPDNGDDDGDDAEREQAEPVATGAGLVAAAGGAGGSFAIGESLMSTKPEGPAPRPPRTPLPGVPRHKEPDPPVVAEEKPMTVTFKKGKPDKNDATMVMTPPPPAAPTAPPTPAPKPPPAAAPPLPAARAAPPSRKKPDSIDMRLDEVVMELSVDPIELDVRKPVSDGVSTAADLDAVRKLFNEVAVAHVSQVRDVMLELRYGEADPRWIEMTRPALQSLRAMAKQMELVDLSASLDAFCTAVEGAVAARVIDDSGKAQLLERYQRLIELIPQAFELDAERDRREPIIVEALLSQIEGVERPTIDRLFAVGLNRLEALMNANAGDVAAVSGLRSEIATKIVAHFQAYRMSAPATVAAPDPHGERRKLADMLVILSLQNDEFNKVSSEWSDDANQRKRTLRKQREQTFQHIKVALARLGERDELVRLERMTFNDRIATIDRWLSAKQVQAPKH